MNTIFEDDSVTVIVPMRNAETTVQECIRSLQKQIYPIKEIIVVDNVSTDNSPSLVTDLSVHSKIPIVLVRQRTDKGLATSYNRGTKMARSSFVIFMTSDSMLPTKYELAKLVKTLNEHPSAVATYASTVLPRYVWNKYNFWEKYYSARMVDNWSSRMILKFDCVRRSIFLKIGGFDENNFGESGIGGEDAEITTRLQREGDIIRSNAIAYHLHYLAPDYNFKRVRTSRKMYARSYGRFLRIAGLRDLRSSVLFLVRPILALLPITPFFRIEACFLILLYSLFYTKEMFLSRVSRQDLRILLVPFLNIFFLYYELFWTAKTFLFRERE